MNPAAIKSALDHAVTAFDRAQEAKAAKPQSWPPRHSHNPHALPAYLGRVADIVADIEAGATPEAAIIAGFTPGPLRNACLKAIGHKASAQEAHGNLLGLPVYQPASQGGAK